MCDNHCINNSEYEYTYTGQMSEGGDESNSEYIPDDSSNLSETDILDEAESLKEELRNLGEPDVTSCTCCTACTRRRGKTGRRPKPFDQVRTARGRNMRVNKRLAGLVRGKKERSEALAIIHRLNRNFPDTKMDSVSNISVLNLIKNLRLSYNQVLFPFLL